MGDGTSLGAPLGEVAEMRGTVIGLTDTEAAADRTMLGAAQTHDGQASRLARRAEWNLPAVAVDPSNVVRMRAADSFADWRAGIDAGLQRASEVEAGGKDLIEARAVLSAELEARYDGIRRELARSRVLRGMQVGWRESASARSWSLLWAGVGRLSGRRSRKRRRGRHRKPG